MNEWTSISGFSSRTCPSWNFILPSPLMQDQTILFWTNTSCWILLSINDTIINAVAQARNLGDILRHFLLPHSPHSARLSAPFNSNFVTFLNLFLLFCLLIPYFNFPLFDSYTSATARRKRKGFPSWTQPWGQAWPGELTVPLWKELP